MIYLFVDGPLKGQVRECATQNFQCVVEEFGVGVTHLYSVVSYGARHRAPVIRVMTTHLWPDPNEVLEALAMAARLPLIKQET